MACAFAADLLAARLGEDTAVAYMTGLLHGIGRLAINKGLLATGHAVKPLFDAGFPDDFSGAEFALFGFTQADVGAAMLTQWSFSGANIEPIRRQYAPLDAEEPHDRMSAILYAARFLRTTICQGEPPAEVEGSEEVFQYLRLSRGEVLESLPALERLVTRAVQITKT
jgi:HD-like signal output (HDOD) protein